MTLTAVDQSGVALVAAARERHPSMKTLEGWASRISEAYLVGPEVRRLEVRCLASNAVGQAVSTVSTQIQCKS